MTSASAKVSTNSHTELVYDVGLVGDLSDLDADRKLGVDGFHRVLEVFSERDDVGAVLHGNAEAERRLAVLANDEAGRVLVAALNRCNVAEPEGLSIRSTGTAAIAATPLKAPVTRRLMRSAEVSTEPPETTAFCLATLSKIAGV